MFKAQRAKGFLCLFTSGHFMHILWKKGDLHGINGKGLVYRRNHSSVFGSMDFMAAGKKQVENMPDERTGKADAFK